MTHCREAERLFGMTYTVTHNPLCQNVTLSDLASIKCKILQDSLKILQAFFKDLARDSLKRILQDLARTVGTMQQVAWCNRVCLKSLLNESSSQSQESLPQGTTLKSGARLDIVARSFYSPKEESFFEVRVSHPGTPTNSEENRKWTSTTKGSYRLRQRRHLCSIVVLNNWRYARRGMGPQAIIFVKKLASHIVIRFAIARK